MHIKECRTWAASILLVGWSRAGASGVSLDQTLGIAIRDGALESPSDDVTNYGSNGSLLDTYIGYVISAAYCPFFLPLQRCS